MDYNYDYIIPENLQQQLMAMLRVNNIERLSELLSMVTFSYEDVGWAYYAGMKGDVWDKHALDCNVHIPEKNIEEFREFIPALKFWLQKILPSNSGLLIRRITVIPKLEEENISLPELKGDTWDVLYTDIMQALSRNEPALVLDRLHTFSVRFIRKLCDKKGIVTVDNSGNHLPLHSLAGMLAKYYQKNNSFESTFSEQAIKTSISLFDKYNGIRNDQSFAHDNKILNDAEAMFAVRVMTATISFIHEFEGV